VVVCYGAGWDWLRDSPTRLLPLGRRLRFGFSYVSAEARHERFDQYELSLG
jgi:hypothetical protein